MRVSESFDRRHQFPAEIMGHCVWLYFRFALSFRDVEELRSSLGVLLTYETVREMVPKIQSRLSQWPTHRLGDRWHLDEVFLKINGWSHYVNAHSKLTPLRRILVKCLTIHVRHLLWFLGGFGRPYVIGFK